MQSNEFLKKKSFEEGDLVEITIGTEKLIGNLMPSIGKTVELKLMNGYNIGINPEQISEIKKLEGAKKTKKEKSLELFKNPELPSITILHTGGTIASKVDYSTGAVYASFEPSDLLTMFPELNGIANFECKLIANIMSEDMRFYHYKEIANAITEEIHKGVKGIIIGHGTDTMHYTAAALSFMLQGINIPVILVGAQRSSDRGSTDSAQNLICASKFISQTDFAGIGICMHENTSDKNCVILPGTKTRKMHSSKRDAFKAINTKPIARITVEGKTEYLQENYSKQSNKNKLESKTRFEEKTALLKTHTNMHSEQFLFYKETNYKGLIIEGTGLGHTPINIEENDEKILKAIKELTDSGCIVGMTTQCLYGRTRMQVYTNMRKLLSIGIIPCEDMLPETAFIKLSWLLGNYSKEETKKMLGKNLIGEITQKTSIDSFDLSDLSE